jgi:hypothetical protein
VDDGLRALKPVEGSPGEWHDIPLGAVEPRHYQLNCPCEPELRVTTKDGRLKSVWVHRRRVTT